MELKELEPFLEKIVKIQKVEGTPEPTDSYMGGYPFVPSNKEGWEWPKTSEDKPLIFVLQINFQDAPKGYGYPESGLLQVFIDYEGYYGSDYKAGLKVIFYDEQTLIFTSRYKPSDVTPTNGDEYSIFSNDDPKKVELKEGYQVPPELYSDTTWHDDTYAVDGKAKDLRELLTKTKLEIPEDLISYCHQLGGTADWVQGSPLDEIQCDSSFMLQIVEDDEIGFGDAGNMHVWGSLEKLREGEISDFQWEWACC